MKTRPINFSSPMVRAILDGQKTQTRKVITPQPIYSENEGFCWKGRATGITIGGKRRDANFIEKCPFGGEGDRLWIREPCWKKFSFVPKVRFDVPDEPGWVRCQAKHMQKQESRTTLEITHVRAERLQEIGIEGALSEGYHGAYPVADFRIDWNAGGCRPARNRWDVNPWVWVIEFKRVHE